MTRNATRRNLKRALSPSVLHEAILCRLDDIEGPGEHNKKEEGPDAPTGQTTGPVLFAHIADCSCIVVVDERTTPGGLWPEKRGTLPVSSGTIARVWHVLSLGAAPCSQQSSSD